MLALVVEDVLSLYGIARAAQMILIGHWIRVNHWFDGALNRVAVARELKLYEPSMVGRV